MTAGAKSLKAQNLKRLVAVAIADAAIMAALAWPTAGMQDVLKGYGWLRAAAAPAALGLVLLLTALVPADFKAVLVFWRLSDVLPGHRAFTEHAARDPRIDQDGLRKNVGAFPTAPAEQNAKWYSLFKKVENEVMVAQAHGYYLLFRDLATLSLLITPVAAVALWAAGAAWRTIGAALTIMAVQYVAAALAARNHGVRFVSNVLALHTVKRRR